MTDARRVVVGVDGSKSSRRALRRAAVEAIAHEATLEIVKAWSLLDRQTGAAFDPHHGAASARAEIEQIVNDELGDERPPLVVRVENDLPARSLLAAAEGAWLVVIGSRGLGGFRGLLLGSVSTQVVHHSPCPVLIVRGTGDAETGPAR
jgi:nucleotide-binding universal stress UspA family protein